MIATTASLSFTLAHKLNSKIHDIFASDLVIKTTCVALASLNFLLSDKFELKDAVALSISLASITLICEKFIKRSNKVSWLNLNNINTQRLKHLFITQIVTLIASYFFTLGVGLKSTSYLDHYQNNYLKLCLNAFILAPIREEILFRGFFKEFIEDMLHVNTCIRPLNHQRISNLAQAFIFGISHMAWYPEIKHKILSCLVIGGFGLLQGRFVNEDQTLVSPMIIHSMCNLNYALRNIVSQLP